MIDDNNGCITKSKLTLTVKTIGKYNNRSRVTAKQTNKQLQRQKTDKHLGRNHTKGINLKFTDLLRTHARGELNEK